MALPPGASLGPYAILAKLGEGGMGEVYRARDTRLGRHVALKVLRPSGGSDEESLLREARLASTLNDPHIVSVFDVGEEAGTVYVAMELVEGSPLSELVRGGGLGVDQILRLAVHVASALARAHAAGLVHRDLKPANVMVTAEGAAKVLDFGLAKRVGAFTGDTATLAGASAPGAVVGTAAYMSPEQAEGRTVDARSDIFSFGATLHELLTGRRVFERESTAATLASILRDPVPPLALSRPDAPRDLLQIVEKCLRKDPARRFQTMADVKVALEDVRDAHVHAPDSGMAGVDVAARPSPRRRWMALTMGGIAIAVAAAALVAYLASDTVVPPRLEATELTQLTFDSGYSGTPALSPDGSLVAFSSDRAGEGNLDIWVQPVGGGSPIQVTRDEVDERTPSFSPDGGRLVFRSERDGGGIYVVPVLGGEPRLLVAEGRSPRFSPDGTKVAYWTGTQIGFAQRAGDYRAFVVAATGGSPRELAGFTGARFPIWSPDGRHLIVTATTSDKPTPDAYDWWVVPAEGGPAVVTGARRLPLLDAPVEIVAAPQAWTGDQVLTSVLGDVWAVTIAPREPFRAVASQRLTFGPAREGDPSATPSGLVAFSNDSSENSIWALPIDSETATLTGDWRRVTDGVGSYARATFSSDEQWIAYHFQKPRASIVIQHLASGRARDLEIPVGGGFGPGLSPDGSQLVYQSGPGRLAVASVKGGAPREICADCENSGDWTMDGRSVMAAKGLGSNTSLVLIDVTTGEQHVVADHEAGQALNRPHLSRDYRWIAFRSTRATSQIFVAPFDRSSPIPRADWVALGEPESDVRPIGWSPSGGRLYFMSSRDGFRCLYNQPMRGGRPNGPAQLVRHMHNLRGAGGGGASVVSTGAGNAVMRQEILVDFPRPVVNLWTMRLGSTSEEPAPPR